MKHKNTPPIIKEPDVPPQEKGIKSLSIKQKTVWWVLLAMGVYLAGETMAPNLNGDGVQFEIAKDETTCHMKRNQYATGHKGYIRWTYLETDEHYSWKRWIQNEESVTLSRHSEFHKITKKSNFNIMTGQRYGGNRYDVSDIISDTVSTGVVIDSNNAILKNCALERKIDFPWCDSGINPWNLCILSNKTKLEMESILNPSSYDGKVSVWWWDRMTRLFSENPTKDIGVLKKRWELIYKVTVQGDLDLSDIGHLPKEYRSLESVKAAIALLKKILQEKIMNDHRLSAMEKLEIEWHIGTGIITPGEIDEMLKKSQGEYDRKIEKKVLEMNKKH